MKLGLSHGVALRVLVNYQYSQPRPARAPRPNFKQIEPESLANLKRGPVYESRRLGTCK